MESGLALLQTWEVFLVILLAPQKDGKAPFIVFCCPAPREEKLCKHLQLENISLQSMASFFAPEGMMRHLQPLLLPLHPYVNLYVGTIIHMCLNIKCQGESWLSPGGRCAGRVGSLPHYSSLMLCKAVLASA